MSGVLGFDCTTISTEEARELINARFRYLNYELVEQINNIFNSWDSRTDLRALLLPLLRIEVEQYDEFESDGNLTDNAYHALQEFLLDLGV